MHPSFHYNPLEILELAKRNLKGCTLRVKRTAYLTITKPNLVYGTPA
jgi:hypothetical protein